LEEAIAMAEGDEEIFIIGGAQIYKQALPLADKLYLTVVHRSYEGDTSFPEIDYSEWREVAREEFSNGEEYDGAFTFIDLERK
jgi:dihydrofolate reductase